MTPIYKTEAELYSLFDRLMRYDEASGNTGEICVYGFERICGHRTPVGAPEYKCNVILRTCTVKRGGQNNELWWARFDILRRRDTWDVIELKQKNPNYEV